MSKVVSGLLIKETGETELVPVDAENPTDSIYRILSPLFPKKITVDCSERWRYGDNYEVWYAHGPGIISSRGCGSELAHSLIGSIVVLGEHTTTVPQEILEEHYQ